MGRLLLFREIIKRHISGKGIGLFHNFSVNICKNSFLNPPKVFPCQTFCKNIQKFLVHMVPRDGKKYFFMFSKTSLNTNFWKVNTFFGFSKKIIKILQNLYLFWFYIILNIAFLKETWVHMENSVIFGHLFLKKQFFCFLNKI